jgi:hypothetical protein
MFAKRGSYAAFSFSHTDDRSAHDEFGYCFLNTSAVSCNGCG